MMAQPQNRTDQSRERFNMRLPKPVLRAVDEARLKRPGSISRNSWIAEAISDKLKHEEIELPPEAWSTNDV
jgi:metal-responsive CopG/Arc/MetJ family transcriptional regulator